MLQLEFAASVAAGTMVDIVSFYDVALAAEMNVRVSPEGTESNVVVLLAVVGNGVHRLNISED